jgi:hypothetical protein
MDKILFLILLGTPDGDLLSVSGINIVTQKK